jgi:hypothetical protein
LLPRSKKGFTIDEKGSGIDLGLLHQPLLLQVIQHDIALWFFVPSPKSALKTVFLLGI